MVLVIARGLDPRRPPAPAGCCRTGRPPHAGCPPPPAPRPRPGPPSPPHRVHIQHVGHRGFRPDRQVRGLALGGQGQQPVQKLPRAVGVPFQRLFGIGLHQPQRQHARFRQGLGQPPETRSQRPPPTGQPRPPPPRQRHRIGRAASDAGSARLRPEGPINSRQLVNRRADPDMADHRPGKTGEDHPAQPFQRQRRRPRTPAPDCAGPAPALPPRPRTAQGPPPEAPPRRAPSSHARQRRSGTARRSRQRQPEIPRTRQQPGPEGPAPVGNLTQQPKQPDQRQRRQRPIPPGCLPKRRHRHQGATASARMTPSRVSRAALHGSGRATAAPRAAAPAAA